MGSLSSGLSSCHVVVIFHTAHPRQDIHQVVLNFRMILTDRPDPNSCGATTKQQTLLTNACNGSAQASAVEQYTQ